MIQANSLGGHISFLGTLISESLFGHGPWALMNWEINNILSLFAHLLNEEQN